MFLNAFPLVLFASGSVRPCYVSLDYATLLFGQLLWKPSFHGDARIGQTRLECYSIVQQGLRTAAEDLAQQMWSVTTRLSLERPSPRKEP